VTPAGNPGATTAARPAGTPVRDRDGLARVAARVLDDLPRLVPALGAAYRDEIPEYAALPPEEMEREVLATSRRFAEAFFSRLLSGRSPAEADLSRLERSGERRLEMGITLDGGMHAFRIAGREVWRATVVATAVDEQHLLAELAAEWIDWVDRASSAFSRGYLAATHQHLRRLDAQRRAIVDALLEASDAGDVAALTARHAIAVARVYTPVLVAGVDVSTRVDPVLAAAPDGSLVGQRGDRVLLLVPGELSDAGPVARAGEGLVVTGLPAAPGPALLREVKAVETLVEAAEVAGRTRGVVGPDDLLAEQLLLGSPRVAASLHRRVTETLAAEDPDGIFTSTLRRYLGCGSVPETAGREYVHVNTVAYRLKRVRDITGLDPRVPADAALLVLAVGSHR
jgi:hypothetical protein